jgi:hypothetical protein
MLSFEPEGGWAGKRRTLIADVAQADIPSDYAAEPQKERNNNATS